MIVIRNSLLPFGRYAAINLFGILFVKNNIALTPELISHERIHTRQMTELLFIPFYIIYVIEWLARLALYRDTYRSYRSISFEREAYRHASDSDYLKHRRAYAQWR